MWHSARKQNKVKQRSKKIGYKPARCGLSNLYDLMALYCPNVLVKTHMDEDRVTYYRYPIVVTFSSHRWSRNMVSSHLEVSERPQRNKGHR